MVTSNKITIFSTALFTIIFLISGCKKESEQNNEIPVVAVSISISPNSTEYVELNPVNGWVYLTGGYRGIIVYRRSLNEFVAFERACPYDWNANNTRIMVDTSGITAQCPTCKSKFILLDGSTYSGPSGYPLKQYQTSYDGNMLYIFN
jgi:nitrite reductase/ring-hydroxylating ferredoxin subunit